MTYFASRRRVLMFGGFTLASGTLDDTWEYPNSAGTGWSQRGPTTIPPRRHSAAMTYDPVRKRAILFGGANPIVGALGDTWEYDGANWSQPTATGAPPARTNAAMAFDQRRNVAVLFGGHTQSGTVLGDHWEYNGATWTQRTFAIRPVPRTRSSMTYDPLRGRIILHGGDNTGGLEDTWEFDGTTWTQVMVEGPPARSTTGFVFDAAAGRALLVGGGFAETWSYGYDAVSGVEACSSRIDADADAAIGCADPDCWGVCTPICAPGLTSCATVPRCGDAVCDDVEDCRSCPGDCPTGTAICPVRCGDFHCDSGETAATCPGDCP
jgi:hypothetical protein